MSEKEAMRQAVEEQLAARLDQWSAQSEAMERRLHRTTGEAGHGDLSRRLEEIQRRHDDAAARLNALRSAPPAGWDAARQEAEQAWNRLDHAIRQATSRLDQLTQQ